MGGSSLAPEVLRRAFDVESFHVLDTTHPAAIRRLEASLELERTLFVVSSKSGSTLETRSHLEYFWEQTGGRGAQFVAITDPGSELERVAGERGFRAVFAGEPEIGGRYSALSMFGIVPAALLGVDLVRFLERAEAMVEACRGEEGNPGLELGLRLGEGWRDGRDKVCLDETHDGLRPLGRAAPRRVDREAGQGPDPGARRVARRPRPPARRAPAGRSLRPRRRVLPLGVRDGRRRPRPRDPSIRPAQRPGGEGQDERGARCR